MIPMFLTLLLAAAPAPPTAAPAPAPKEKTICKRQVDTGSLVRGRKTCLTAREYRRQVEEAQESTARLQFSGSGSGPK